MLSLISYIWFAWGRDFLLASIDKRNKYSNCFNVHVGVGVVSQTDLKNMWTYPLIIKPSFESASFSRVSAAYTFLSSYFLFAVRWRLNNVSVKTIWDMMQVRHNACWYFVMVSEPICFLHLMHCWMWVLYMVYYSTTTGKTICEWLICCL